MFNLPPDVILKTGNEKIEILPRFDENVLEVLKSILEQNRMILEQNKIIVEQLSKPPHIMITNKGGGYS